MKPNKPKAGNHRKIFFNMIFLRLLDRNIYIPEGDREHERVPLYGIWILTEL